MIDRRVADEIVRTTITRPKKNDKSGQIDKL